MHKTLCICKGSYIKCKWLIFFILQEISLTHHEVVEYSDQCTEEPLSSWAVEINDHGVEEERFEIYSYSQESRSA